MNTDNKTISNDAIQLTKKAAEHVHHFLAKDGKGIGLRLMVQSTGCSGFQYVVETADEHRPHDHIFESRGIKVFIDDLSLPYLQGTSVDYAREGLNEGFRFDNPNAQSTCGCGESFSITEESVG